MFKALIVSIAAALSKAKITYMILGGQAVLLYGEPRLTRDIDITLGIGSEQLPTVLTLLPELALKPIPDDVTAFVERTMVLPVHDDRSGIRVDFIFSFRPYEKGAIARTRKILMDGVEVAFASPEDVIVHKIFAGRPRDLEDVRSILLKTPNIDSAYIVRWLKEFEAAFPDGAFVTTFASLLKE